MSIIDVTQVLYPPLLHSSDLICSRPTTGGSFLPLLAVYQEGIVSEAAELRVLPCKAIETCPLVVPVNLWAGERSGARGCMINQSLQELLACPRANRVGIVCK